MSASQAQAAPLVATLSTLDLHTGTWRNAFPVYVNQTSPCRAACPVGQDVARWMLHIRRGEARKGWDTLAGENPLPGVTGRVCSASCEAECHRNGLDGAVAINALERCLADSARVAGWELPGNAAATGRRVAVVGTGPAGLACAYFLLRLGHAVKAFEKRSEPGGMLRYGIPSYRLPKDVLAVEIARLEKLGLEIETGCEIGKRLGLDDLSGYDAVFLAPGAQQAVTLSVSGADGGAVWNGIDFLGRVNAGERLTLPGAVLVVGGGSTAVDVARTARRLGARVEIAALEGPEQMPALAAELSEAVEEGIEIRHNTMVVAIEAGESGVEAVRCEKVRLEIPAPGVLNPVSLGEAFYLRADLIIQAIGQRPDLSFLPETMAGATLDRPGLGPLLAVDEFGAITGYPGFYAGGDATLNRRSVAHAIGAGKRAAIGIHAFLTGCDLKRIVPSSRLGRKGSVSIGPLLGPQDPPGNEGVRSRPEAVVSPSQVVYDYFSPAGRAKPRLLPVADRLRGFGEVVVPLAAERANAESERCFHCGLCVGCDNCWVFCPDAAVVRLGNGRGYRILEQYCKGCGLCAAECPRGALVMESEGRR